MDIKQKTVIISLIVFSISLVILLGLLLFEVSLTNLIFFKIVISIDIISLILLLLGFITIQIDKKNSKYNEKNI